MKKPKTSWKNLNQALKDGWVIVLFFSFFPIILWLVSPAPIPRFSNFITSMANVGQLTALVGMAMFSINIILSARLRFLDVAFRGLHRVYYKHSLLGQLALVLLLLHPLFLLPKYSGGSFSTAASFLLPGSDWARNWGWISLAGMIGLIILTLYLRPKYNIWKITHKFFGLLFLAGVFHAYLTPSDVARSASLRFYMLTLAGIALVSFTYRTLLGKFLIKQHRYAVHTVKLLGDEIIEIEMAPMGDNFIFTPGQFIFVKFFDKNLSPESHPFSISSGPRDKNLKITVKKLGDYTNQLDKLSVGAEAQIEGPFGAFSSKKSATKNQIWIAGGIGITPFLSMARELRPEDGYSVILYYCVKKIEEAVYLEELKNINPLIKIYTYCSSEQGRFTAANVIKDQGSLENKDFFVCAPPAMISALRKQLKEAGVDKTFIHSEEFNF